MGASIRYRPPLRKPSKSLVFHDEYYSGKVLPDPPDSPKTIENKDIAG
jgi:hypothetical protein